MSNADHDEAKRLERLRQFAILDTEEDERFDRCAEQALHVFEGATIAAVSLIDEHRQWFKSILGLDIRETPRDVAFCAHTIESSGVMVVEDATRDPRFARNPLVTGGPNIRFYAGVKLVHRVGALCVIGNEPRHATKSEINKLVAIARYVDIQLLAHGTLHHL